MPVDQARQRPARVAAVALHALASRPVVGWCADLGRGPPQVVRAVFAALGAAPLLESLLRQFIPAPELLLASLARFQLLHRFLQVLNVGPVHQVGGR